MTSLASVCGLFSSSLVEGGNAKSTIIGHGSPSENDLMEILVLCGHDGEIELTRVGRYPSICFILAGNLRPFVPAGKTLFGTKVFQLLHVRR